MDERALTIALRELGVREVPGIANNGRILEYHGATALHATADEVAWCSAFLCWVFARAGVDTRRSAAAASWLKWGIVLDAPRLGAVTVLARAGSSPAALLAWADSGRVEAPPAHVGLWLAGDEASCWLIGGNQGNAVSVAAFARSRVVGWRWRQLPAPAGEGGSHAVG